MHAELFPHWLLLWEIALLNVHKSKCHRSWNGVTYEFLGEQTSFFLHIFYSLFFWQQIGCQQKKKQNKRYSLYLIKIKISKLNNIPFPNFLRMKFKMSKQWSQETDSCVEALFFGISLQSLKNEVQTSITNDDLTSIYGYFDTKNVY